jgi:hypothetical protein
LLRAHVVLLSLATLPTSLARDRKANGHWYPVACGQLLNKDPAGRLGRNQMAMKRHPFFEGLNWDALEKLEVAGLSPELFCCLRLPLISSPALAPLMPVL